MSDVDVVTLAVPLVVHHHLKPLPMLIQRSSYRRHLVPLQRHVLHRDGGVGRSFRAVRPECDVRLVAFLWCQEVVGE